MPSLRIIRLAALLVLPFSASATTIIFYADSNRVVTASDGKIQVVGQSSLIGPKFKVWNEKVVVAASGFFKEGDNFDAFEIAETFLSRPKPLTNLLDSANQIASTCSNYFQRVFRSPLGSNLVNTSGNRRLLDIGIGSMLSGSPEFHFRYFHLETNAGVFRITVDQDDLNFTSTTPPMFKTMGQDAHILGLLTNEQFLRSQRNATNALISAIRREIRALPDEVGLPIYVVELPKPGGKVTWAVVKE